MPDLEITANMVTVSVAKQLAGAGYKGRLYSERQGQNFKRPAIVIYQLFLSSEKRMRRRYRRTYRMRLHVFPALTDDCPRQYFGEMELFLVETLGLLYFDDVHCVFGREMEFEEADGVGHFGVTFTIEGDWNGPNMPTMKTLDLNEAIKERS